MELEIKIRQTDVFLDPNTKFPVIESDINTLLLRTNYDGELFRIEKIKFVYDTARYKDYEPENIRNEDIILEYLENGFISMEDKV